MSGAALRIESAARDVQSADSDFGDAANANAVGANDRHNGGTEVLLAVSAPNFAGFGQVTPSRESSWGDVALASWVLGGVLAVACVVYRKRLSLALPLAVGACLALGVTGTLLSARTDGVAWTAGEKPGRFHTLVTPRYFAALRMHRAATGALPERLDDLSLAEFAPIALGGYDVAMFSDAWERPMRYERAPNGESATLISAGPDGRFGTADDLHFSRRRPPADPKANAP